VFLQETSTDNVQRLFIGNIRQAVKLCKFFFFVQMDVLKLKVKYFKNEFNFSLNFVLKNSLISTFDYTFFPRISRAY